MSFDSPFRQGSVFSHDVPISVRVIGILGGVASGKSLVAAELARLGAVLLDADRAGHEVLRKPQVESAAQKRWGAKVFGPDGRIDREKLAKIVFSAPPTGPGERKFLEQLTHPLIVDVLRGQVRAMALAGSGTAVLDAPLIVEAGWDKLCDRLVFVDAPRELRLARAIDRGWSEKDFAAREGVQESLDSKRPRADVVVDNSASLEHTQAQVEQIWQSLSR